MMGGNNPKQYKLYIRNCINHKLLYELLYCICRSTNGVLY